MSRLRVRMRPDLVIERAAAVDRWVVFDPVALRYFELRDEECAVLRMLDGKIDVAELRARFERIFVPQRLSTPVLESFLHRLHEYGLVLADSPGQGQVWDSRRQAARRRAWWLACANPLAIRLPAIGAADAVARLARAVGWLFTPPVMWMAFVAVSWAAFVAATHSEELASELPRAQAWFAGETSHGPVSNGPVSNGPVSSGLVSNGPFSHGASPPGIATALAANLWWLATLAVVKCCHELGHALLLAHWGGRVHAVGAMLFVFAPALYCDVSDAWRLPSRWRRVAVGMAGVGAELFLAAVAVAVWRMTEPGLWHALALKTMVVCTIGTLFFNANPLVRGDAYYVLADLAGVPNLATEARRALSRSIRGMLVGHEPDRGEGGGDDGGDHGGVDGVPRLRWILAAYGLLSVLCVGFFYWTAVGWTADALYPLGLSDLSKILAVVVAAGAVGPPAMSMYREWRRPARPRPWRWRRLSLAAVLLAAAAALVWLVPVPRRVWAPVVLELSSAQPVYVTVPGTLVWRLSPGSRVASGDPIARLENEPLVDEQRALAAELAVQELRVSQLRVRLSNDASLAPLLPVEEERLRGLSEQHRQLSDELARLVLRAERSGVIVEPPRRHASRGDAGWGAAGAASSPGSQMSGAAWDGSPFESRNLGCYLEVGTAICEVGELAEVEGHASISLVDLPSVRAGQSATVCLDAAPASVLAGAVSDVSRSDTRSSQAGPGRMRGGLGDPVGTTRGSGDALRGGAMPHAFSAVDESAEWVRYEARIAFSVPPEPYVLPGAHGWARIDADWEPLGKRFWRAIRRTFKE